MKFGLVLLFLVLSNLASAQQWDSMNFNLRLDTLLQKSIQKADSITLSFQSKADSLSALYQKQFSRIDSVRSHLQSKIDNLNHLKLPTDKVTIKMDSLNQVVNEKVSLLTKKLNDLKSKATEDLKEIQLPPQLQEPMQKLQSSIAGYSLPSLKTTALGMPSVNFPDHGNVQLTTLSKQLNLDTNFGNISDELGNIKEIAGNAKEYTQDAENLVKGNLNEVKNIDKTLEAELMDMEGMNQLKEGSALLGANPMDSAALANKAKEMIKEQVMNAAQDHFAGKQELLQEAMGKMTKLKTKYSEVKSMAELPKRLPNPLKGKPFVERLVPALTFQIQKSGNFLVDINPMLMYRISPRISAGAGWNQRFAFNDLTINRAESIYGPRAAFEFKWTRGINFRLLPEIMNTTIPPHVAQSKGVDPVYREWVGSMFFGIKKDFTVYKQIKGNTEILYNLYDPGGMSPYGDKLSVRFGFEFAMKEQGRIKN